MRHFPYSSSNGFRYTDIVYDFDTKSVELFTGFDGDTIMGDIADFYHTLDERRLNGYIDLQYILADALTSTLPGHGLYTKRYQQIYSQDYFAILSDMAYSSDYAEEVMEDDVYDTAALCLRIHNYFVLGLVINLDQEERQYLSSIILSTEDTPRTQDAQEAIKVTQDLICIRCMVPDKLKEQEDEDVIRLHHSIIHRLDRGLSHHRNPRRDTR